MKYLFPDKHPSLLIVSWHKVQSCHVLRMLNSHWSHWRTRMLITFQVCKCSASFRIWSKVNFHSELRANKVALLVFCFFFLFFPLSLWVNQINGLSVIFPWILFVLLKDSAGRLIALEYLIHLFVEFMLHVRSLLSRYTHKENTYIYFLKYITPQKSRLRGIKGKLESTLKAKAEPYAWHHSDCFVALQMGSSMSKATTAYGEGETQSLAAAYPNLRAFGALLVLSGLELS